MARSDWAVFLLSVSVVTALNVKFQETDITVKEESKTLKAVVTMEHNTNSNVTIEVIPRTIRQYVASGQPLPPDINLAIADPAEEGLDFDGSPHTIFLGSGTRQMKVVNIPIIEDNLTEREEIFLLELRIIRVDPPENVYSDRNVTVVRITPSALDYTRIRLVAEKTHFHESNGTISDAIYIELDREIEPNITVQLSQSTIGVFGGFPKDLRLPKFFPIPSRTRRIYVPFQIIDDNINEGSQKVGLYLVKKPQNVFEVDTTMVMLTIEDNDVAKIGFTWNGTATGFLEMVEGEAQVFCVAVLEPQATELIFVISLSNSPDLKNTSITLNQTGSDIYLFSQSSATCISITVPDNEFINKVQNIIFQIKTKNNEEVILDPSLLNIAIRDNDGSPMKPKITDMSQKASDLHISWTAEVNKFKPIEKFIVAVTEVDTVSSVISRRQTNQLSKEHETNGTSYMITINERMLYFIKVCSLNKNFRNCSKEVEFLVESKTVTKYISSPENERSYFLEDPTPIALINGGKKSLGGLGRTSFIAVIVGPAVAFTLSLILLLTVLFCKCWGERRQYYPSKQEKILMASNIEMKNYYYRQRSSTSSISTDWTLTSPNNYFMSPPKEAKPKIFTLGTPV